MQGKPVALVTGANKGIGLQIARDLTTHGFSVLIGSRGLENGEEAARSIGADAHALQLDVTNQASISAAAERVRSEFGRLDVLVNNAGQPGASFEEIVQASSLATAPLDDVRAVFETGRRAPSRTRTAPSRGDVPAPSTSTCRGGSSYEQHPF